MDVSQAILLRNSLRNNHVIMAYNGTVSDDLMVTLADLLKERLVANDDVIPRSADRILDERA